MQQVDDRMVLFVMGWIVVLILIFLDMIRTVIRLNKEDEE